MKLSNQEVQQLTNILNTCLIGGVETLIIEDGKVRAVNESKTFAIISDHQVPKLPKKMGLSRISALKSRMDLFAGNVVIDANDNSREEISFLDISSGKSKVQFRCTSTALIKAPSSINDSAELTVFLDKSEMKLILDAVRVMSAKLVNFSFKDKGVVTVQIKDSSNECFTINLNSPFSLVSGENVLEDVNYSSDVLSAVIKKNMEDISTLSLSIGGRGTLTTRVSGHTVVLLPQVGDN